MEKLVNKMLVGVFCVYMIGCDSPDSNDPLPETPDVGLLGTAFDGLLIDTRISIYSFSGGVRGELLGSAITDAIGDYTATIQISKDQPILVCASGDLSLNSYYTEEASAIKVFIDETQEFCAVSNFAMNDTIGISITHLTHAATAKAMYYISTGMPVATAIDSANTEISRLIFAEGEGDIISVKPLDITLDQNRTSVATPGHLYGAATAGVSQYMKSMSEKNGVDVHTIYTSFLYGQKEFQDIAFDGVVNGIGETLLDFGTEPITVKTYRHEIAKSILHVMAGPNNLSGLTPGNEAILAMVQRLNNSTDSIFGGAPVTNFSDEIPIISNVSINDAAVLSLDVTLSADITDLVGLVNVTFTLIDDNNVPTELASFVADDLFSYSFDTTSRLDGAYKILIDATNNLSNNTLVTINVIIENNKMSFSNISPVENSYLKLPFTLTANVSGSLPIAKVVLAIDGNPTQNAVTPETPSFEVFNLIDGTHSFSLQAFNSIDNTATYGPFDYIIDTTVPALNFPGISANATLYGDTLISIDATDNIQLDRVNLYLNNDNPPVSEILASFTTFGSPLSVNIATDLKADGPWRLVAEAFDMAANKTILDLPITIDNSPPTITFVTISPGTPVGGTNYSATFEIFDSAGIQSVAYFMDGVPISTISETITNTTYTMEFNSELYNDGNHVLSVNAVDGLGFGIEPGNTIIVDNNTLSVTPILYSQNGYPSGGLCPVFVDASSLSGIASVEIVLDGGAGQYALTETSPGSFEGTVYVNPVIITINGKWNYTLYTFLVTNKAGVTFTTTQFGAYGNDPAQSPYTNNECSSNKVPIL